MQSASCRYVLNVQATVVFHLPISVSQLCLKMYPYCMCAAKALHAR